MTLQQSGQISALDIIVEEAIHPQDSLGMNTTLSRNLAKRSSGQIAYSDFYGKSSVVPGCQEFTTSTVFQIPAFNYVLSIEVWGAGASGGNSNSNLGPAAAGGYSVAKLNGGWLVGYGGQGGQNQLSWTGHRGHYDGYGGVGGAASGGDINMSGGDGAAGQPAAPGRGGTAVRGGAGGAGQYPVGQNGGFPGGGGGGTGEGSGGGKFSWDCGGGGAGGYVAKNIFKGDGYAPPYSTAIIEIGAPGLGVAVYGTEKGGDGAAGYCRICWDMGAVAPLPAGTYINSFCYLYGLYYTLADGNNGTYIQLAQSNSPACGYVAPADPGSGGDGPCCFSSESMVLMADMTYKAIAEIQIGEQIINDAGNISSVINTKQTVVGNRKMIKFANKNIVVTDDHLFLTDKGWKTWNPNYVISNNHPNAVYLKGLNRTTPIQSGDKLRVAYQDNNVTHFNFVEYDSLGITSHTYPSDYVVYDLDITDGVDDYIVEGFVVHNCSS